MTVLQHIVEPERLLLTWQPTDESSPNRTRRIVGEICQTPNGQAVFRYLIGSHDFQAAQMDGFKGFPAFPLKEKEPETDQNVIESLMRRLPSRKREDFSDYLARHSLPAPFDYSDFALLGYTGAKLPSDGFSLVPVFPEDAVPCDYLTEVAGLRHVFDGTIETIQKGDPVFFEVDSDNPIDQDALAVIHQGRRVGYINRAFRQTVHRWVHSHQVSAWVDRLNGKPERRLIYVRFSIRAFQGNSNAKYTFCHDSESIGPESSRKIDRT